jgi:hypothetical protein
VVTLAATVDLRSRFGLRHLEPRAETTTTDERMALLELIEKQADSDLVREMLAFAADRIMELEVELRTGAAKARARRSARRSATDIGSETGTPGPAGSRWKSRSCARAAICRASWSRGERPRRRSWRLYRKPISTGSPRAPSMTW